MADQHIISFVSYAAGFLVEYESIDEDQQIVQTKKYTTPAQLIDVYDNGSDPGSENNVAEVDHEDIWNLLQPFVPTITDIVKANRDKEAFSQFYPHEPDREPELNWVFFRKYSPKDKRNSLQLHHDTNMNTVNIEVGDDYMGGGFLYVKPLAITGYINDEYDNYEWIDNVERINTTDIIFPELHVGDAISYNYSVQHGVAPIESGTRVRLYACRVL